MVVTKWRSFGLICTEECSLLMKWRPSKTSEHLSKMLRHLNSKYVCTLFTGDLYSVMYCQIYMICICSTAVPEWAADGTRHLNICIYNRTQADICRSSRRLRRWLISTLLANAQLTSLRCSCQDRVTRSTLEQLVDVLNGTFTIFFRLPVLYYKKLWFELHLV